MMEEVPMKIGYIGLGAMGSALAGRLLKAHTLTVWDINSAATSSFERQGASVAPTAAELARHCDVAVLCLPRSADVRQVVLGPGGLIEGLSAGKLVIDQTSGVPGETFQIAELLAARGVTMIDAPVSGGVSGAAAGTISIMASGADDAWERALVVLKSISPNVFRCGVRVGDAQATKLVNNILSAGCRLAALEVVAFGRKLGLSLKTATEVLNRGVGRNRTSKVMLQTLVDGKPSSSSFAMALMLKDMNQAIALGMTCGASMGLTSIVRAMLQIGVNTLGSDAQLERVLELVESMAGTTITESAAVGGGPAPRQVEAGGFGELRVGFAGFGSLSHAVARRMVGSQKVHVHATNCAAVSELVAAGAVREADLSSLVRVADVIVIDEPDPDRVRALLFGDRGRIDELLRGKILVNHATCDPSATRVLATELETAGIALIDAPLSGAFGDVAAGSGSVLCGGPTIAFKKAKSALESIGPNVVYCGTTGSGNLAKLVDTAVSACNRALTCEAVAMGLKYGLSLADLSKVINASTGWSGVSERMLPTLVSGAPASDLCLSTELEALELASEAAMHANAPMLIANAARCLYEAGTNQLGESASVDSLPRLFGAMSGVEFASS
jgi:3-hydroxyisobutyrate dehydrogenase